MGEMKATGRNGTILFDGRVITIQRPGLADRVLPLSMVARVVCIPAILTWDGHLSLVLPGEIGPMTRKQIQRDPFTVTFGRRRNDEFKAISDAMHLVRAGI